jgi:dihydroxy-acid dehydratase
VLKHLAPLLDRAAPTAIGVPLGEVLSATDVTAADCLRPISNPFQAAGGLGVVRGNLAPRGAIIKRSAAKQELWLHEGPALVYENARDAVTRPLDPSFDCDDSSVLVVRGAGPVGGPGMPELGRIPIPMTLRLRGVTDMVCISDARISGTQKGATVLHATPESALGGPLAAVADGDVIKLDAVGGSLDVLIDDEEIARRLAALPPRRPAPSRGYERLFHDHVLQADEGCDFDFLRDPTLESIPLDTAS